MAAIDPMNTSPATPNAVLFEKVVADTPPGAQHAEVGQLAVRPLSEGTPSATSLAAQNEGRGGTCRLPIAGLLSKSGARMV